MLELWQTEWCPASRRVRARLTELGIDYITRQVPVDRTQRTVLRDTTGSDSIPALVLDDRSAVVGEDAIRRYLDDRIPEPAGAAAHRLKAERARRRYLEEECRCLQAASR
jgi:glutaredoxin 3